MFGSNSVINKSINKIQNSPTLFAILVIIEFIIFVLIAYRWNPYDISDKYPAQVALFFLITLFIQSVNFYFIKEKAHLNKTGDFNTPGIGNFTLKVFATLGAIIGIVFLLMGIWWLVRHIPALHTITVWSLNILIISGALGVAYMLFKPLINRYKQGSGNKNTLASFFANLIFYIPCLMIQFADYLKHQYNITGNTTWIILFLEIILIGLRFIIPQIWEKIITHDGVNLLEDPVYLNNEHTLGNYESLHADNNNDSNGNNGKFKYNYAISAWFYLNPQPPNTSAAYTKYSNILNYGQKPLIQYNGKRNKLRVQTEINDGDLETIYETSDIKYQTWNNIVINYDGGNMDIFINGDIVATRKNVAPYMRYENVTIGEKNGIHGGICNIIYYKRVLSLGHIKLVYKTLREKGYPVL